MPLPDPYNNKRCASRSQRDPDPYLKRTGAGSGIDEWLLHSRSIAETEQLGRLIGQSLAGGEVIALYGELGTGKTALVRGVAAGLGAPPRSVSSPTFVLIHEYQGRLRFAHVDLYRLSAATELYHLGLQDYFDGHTVVAIEWADQAGTELPSDHLAIQLIHQSKKSRTIRMSATGMQSRQLLHRLVSKEREP